MLPLRGKILNVERKDEASLYKNTEIQSNHWAGTWNESECIIVSHTKLHTFLFVIIIELSYIVFFVQG